MSKLVIVESPNKVSTIQKYLGNDYEVVASVGHIAKLSTSGKMGLGIDLETWEPKYVLDPTKKDIVSKLKKKAKEAEHVYIATDPDREGEAIGDHLVEYLKIADKYNRIKYNEITKDAILQALNYPLKIDEALVKAQKTRRMLDRIIGFRLSKLMKDKVANSPTNPSAGRVQSIALKLVVDREKEIEAFIPRDYHKLDAKLNEQISAVYYNDANISAEKEWIYPEQLVAIKEQLAKADNQLKVTDIVESERSLAKITPFKQSVLYKRSPFSSTITQSSAQRLYEGYGEGGLISYPRTDSTRLSQTFINHAHSFIKQTYGAQYILDEIKGFSGDQDAHEAIRPTDLSLTPEKALKQYDLNTYDYQIYKLIYEHTLQALIKPPVRRSKLYILTQNDLHFRFNFSKVIFDGYYIIKKEVEDLQDPNYSLNQLVNVQEFIFSDHQTKPLPRYTEGSLIEALDNIKVGRPSTFATTVKIILDRQYAENQSGSLHPTEFGRLVLQKLLDSFPNIINETYTAQVEEELDNIANDNLEVQPVMQDFYDRFTKTFEEASKTMEMTMMQPITMDDPCPECKGTLIVRRNFRGQNFVGCANFPNCKYTRNYGEQKPVFFRRKKAK